MITKDILSAVKRLKQNDVVGMPTETVYGLAACIDSNEGLNKIFAIKERPFFDPLIVHISSLEQIKQLTPAWGDIHQLLAKQFWPGPLTMILPKAEGLNPIITSGLNSVGVRFPNHPMALELITKLGVPVAAPSANKFGKTSPTNALHVNQEFDDQVLVLDGGECQVGIESTVLEVVTHGNKSEIKIYRPGMIQAQDLRLFLKNAGLEEIAVYHAQSEVAPGHLKHHYMPNIPLILSESRDKIIQTYQHQKIVWLDLPDDPNMAARLLYQKMRENAESGAEIMAFELTPLRKEESWIPIMNRIEKAATKKI